MFLRQLCRSIFPSRLPVSARLFTPLVSGGGPPLSGERRFGTGRTDESFLSGNSANYLEELFERWRASPADVPADWKQYFERISAGPALPSGPAATLPAAGLSGEVLDHMKLQNLVRSYRFRGHLRADLDPLKIVNNARTEELSELDPAYHGLSEADLDREFLLGSGVLPYFVTRGDRMTLREILAALRKVYCGTIGFEYMHIAAKEPCEWLRSKFEVPEAFALSKAEKTKLLERLAWASLFERFVATKYPADKRFGLEGGEALVPGMIDVLYKLSADGVENVILGMAHRGRLNVLTNVVRKPLESILCEFSGTNDKNSVGTGDVKYHLGMQFSKPMVGTGKTMEISLMANPSHLEAVNPVVLGKTHGLQFHQKGVEKTAALLIHGDASFAGQGVVYESLGLADLPSYSVGGTLHLIINNQIGFTTDPRFARSTPYCSDVAKTLQAPIFHVNGDDPEAVIQACRLAADWRTRYKTDVVVDMVCYRRHGHNETDQPSFTQPRMYQAIAKQTPVYELYKARLLAEGALTRAEVDAIETKILTSYEGSYKASKTYVPTAKEWVSSHWQGFRNLRELRDSYCQPYDTGVDTKQLVNVGRRSSSWPEHFKPHPGIRRIMDARTRTIEDGKDIDMPTAEALAFGTLLTEGFHVRLSGQDVERGTFSQRHSVLHDQAVEQQHVPLQHIASEQAPFTVCNSSLSEYAVLGFELGYSMVTPKSLTLWEAQFGDFCNTAQPVIDQFISSGEKKWLNRTNLTLLLPHGYDGAGPEHSNAHIERFLSLCDEDPYTPQLSDEQNPKTRQIQDCNMQLVYPSTPASYFHALRRQVHRDFRKPLVLFTSKSLLRHPLARSTLADMAAGTRFQKLIPAAHPDPAKVSRLIFCSGQVYYTLQRSIAANRLANVAVARIEQLSPFPWDQFAAECDRFPQATDIVWAQEEPMNLGPWSYMEPRFYTALQHLSAHHKGKRARYAGRRVTAAVATGFKYQHMAEEHELLAQALLNEKKEPKAVESGVAIW